MRTDAGDAFTREGMDRIRRDGQLGSRRWTGELKSDRETGRVRVTRNAVRDSRLHRRDAVLIRVAPRVPDHHGVLLAHLGPEAPAGPPRGVEQEDRKRAADEVPVATRVVTQRTKVVVLEHAALLLGGRHRKDDIRTRKDRIQQFVFLAAGGAFHRMVWLTARVSRSRSVVKRSGTERSESTARGGWVRFGFVTIILEI